MTSKVQKLVERMRYWCLEGNLGYDQYQRWNIRSGGECDCSSLVIWCLHEAGFDTGNTPRYGVMPTTGATYTGNMSYVLTHRGWTRVPNNGKPQLGDILLSDKHHVAVYVGNGQLAQASIDERGKAYGGQSGDQGNETNVRAYYNYPWDCYLRYTAKDEEEEMPLTAAEKKEIAKLCADEVWSRLIDNKKASTRLKDASDALTDTSDPTGRGMKLTLTKHVKWIAKVLQDVKNELDEIKERAID